MNQNNHPTVRPPARRAALGAQLAVALVLLSATNLGHAQSQPAGSPCAATVNHINTARTRDLEKINNQLGQNISMAANAKKCIDRVIQIAEQVTAPKFPNIARLSMDRIMSYLANAACQVVVKQAEGVVSDINGSLRPIADQLRQFEGQANAAIGQVQWSGGMADPVYNFNSPNATTLPPVPTVGNGGRTTPPPSVRDPNCALGFGPNCTRP